MAISGATMSRIKNVDKAAENVMEYIPTMPILVAVLGSIAVSAALFLTGRRNWGLFVGLWAPTLLDLALMNRFVKEERIE